MPLQVSYFCQPANGHESKDKSNAIDQRKKIVYVLLMSYRNVKATTVVTLLYRGQIQLIAKTL